MSGEVNLGVLRDKLDTLMEEEMDSLGLHDRVTVIVNRMLKVKGKKAQREVLERYFLMILEGLPSLYLVKGHTCSSKTKRLDIDVLIKYLNDKKKELSSK